MKYIVMALLLVTALFRAEVTNAQEAVKKPADEAVVLVRMKFGDKYGYIDKTGRVVIAPQEAAGDFSEGLAYVKQNGKYGYIDKTGRVVIAPQWEDASSFSDGLARVPPTTTGTPPT